MARDLYQSGDAGIGALATVISSGPSGLLDRLDNARKAGAAARGIVSQAQDARAELALANATVLALTLRIDAASGSVAAAEQGVKDAERVLAEIDARLQALSISAPQQQVGPDGCPTANVAGTLRDGSDLIGAAALCRAAVRQAATPQAALAIQWAFAHLGAPYACGGAGRLQPFRMDCSSFVSRAYAEGAGLRTAGPGWAPSTRNMVPWDGVALDPHYAVVAPIALRAGDLVLYDTCPQGGCPYKHVVMYLGSPDGGQSFWMAHTNACGDIAKVERFWGFPTAGHPFLVARRVIALPGETVSRPASPDRRAPTVTFVDRRNTWSGFREGARPTPSARDNLRGMTEASTTSSRAYAEQLDDADPLAAFRLRFTEPDPFVVYLDGNSLGRLPAATAARIADVVTDEWGDRLIRSWSEGWMELPVEVGDRLGVALLGASPGQTLVCDNVTVNTFKLLHAAMDLRPGRHTIVAHRREFPTDRYVAAEVARQRGGSVRWLGFLDPDAAPPVDPVTASDVAGVLSDDVAVVLLSVVDYRSAAIAEVAEITRAVHDAGALVVWDCSHAVGSLPLQLDTVEADFAVGCSYKYLNGGPGAPAWIWAATRHHDAMRNPVPGWMGHHEVFAMGPDYIPAVGVRRFLTGTPSAIALAAVDIGVGLLAEAGMDAVRAKSVALTSYAIDLADAWLAGYGVTLASPRDPGLRGSHVTLRHPDALALTQALTDRGVIPDFRHPDGVRLGLAPLTTRFTAVHDGIASLRALLEALG